MKYFSLKKIFYNDQRLKLFSIIAAILFWFIVVINISPDCSRTIGNIKLDKDSDNTSFSGYKIIDSENSTVKVEVSGPRYLVGKLSSKDFIVKPKDKSITAAGNVKVDLDATLADPDYRIKIKSVTPSSEMVYFDKMGTKTLPVTVQVQEATAASGYAMQPAISSPSQVVVTGPKTYIDQLGLAITKIHAGDNLTDDASAESEIELYNTDGKKTDIKYLNVSVNKVKVTVPVYKVADIHLGADFNNIPAGFDTANLSYSFNPGTIKVAAKSSALSTLNVIDTGKINFLTLGLDNTIPLTITLPTGVLNTENQTNTVLTVTLKNTSTKTCTVKKITAENLPTGYKVVMKTKKISDVLLYGPSSGIAGAEPQAVADFSQIDVKTGNQYVPVTIYVPGQNGYWVTKQYQAYLYLFKTK